MTSAERISRSAFRVISSGSPGPTPTPHTMPVMTLLPRARRAAPSPAMRARVRARVAGPAARSAPSWLDPGVLGHGHQRAPALVGADGLGTADGDAAQGAAAGPLPGEQARLA